MCGKRESGGGEGYEEEMRMDTEVEEGKEDEPVSHCLGHSLRQSWVSKQSLLAPYHPTHARALFCPEKRVNKQSQSYRFTEQGGSC
jgi:hypothetical protein